MYDPDQLMAANESVITGGPGLKRVLGLPALVLYGIILIQPTAPMPLFGAAAVKAQGHVVTTILIGMVAMLFTAVGYGRMANAYPSAGSAYAYVSREIHPAPGYLVGWGMIFDYVMNPIICVIWCSVAARNILPLPFWVFAIFFALLFTGMNLRGIEASTRTNAIIAAGLGVVIVLFLGAAVRYLWLHPPGGFAGWSQPFYDPNTFSFRTVSGGAALAVLTYIGFDGISTLSEEVHNPRRNILLATVLVCLLTGVLASIQVYTAQLVWPETTFPKLETAFADVAGRAGGLWLFHTVNAALLIATIGSGSGAHLGAGRLLYGMGRDNAIPRQVLRGSQSAHAGSEQQHHPRGRRDADWRLRAHLRPGGGDAELRCADRLYGGERLVIRALLREGRAEAFRELHRAGVGLRGLPLPLAEPGHRRRRAAGFGLAGAGRALRGVAHVVVPEADGLCTDYERRGAQASQPIS